MIGLITAGPYSAAHDSALNKTYVADFQKTDGERPDFASLGAYDGLHLVYEALKKTGGDADGDKLIAAMKGMAWESPRGPISIDPATRDIVSNIYIRKVEKIDGQLWAKEFETFPNVKDPMKVAREVSSGNYTARFRSTASCRSAPRPVGGSARPLARRPAPASRRCALRGNRAQSRRFAIAARPSLEHGRRSACRPRSGRRTP